MVLFVLTSVAAAAGAVSGVLSIFRLRTLNNRLQRIERELAEFSRPVTPATPTELTSARAQGDRSEDTRTSPPVGQEVPTFVSRSVLPTEEVGTADTEATIPVTASVDTVVHLQTRWMIWLGGLCVALAGVFLARYSIEMGLIGPKARLSLGVLMGFALYVGAEWLRRKTEESHPAFAAMAGGGSITLFAVLLAALHLYAFLSPAVTFGLLALVALATMSLAHIYGAVLAVIGILGAYVVPLLVAGDVDHINFSLGYSLVISASALLLMRSVYRPWLWWGFLAGALGWWAISMATDMADGVRVWYLAGLGYLVLALPTFDWSLSRSETVTVNRYLELLRNIVREPAKNHLPLCFLLLISAQAVSVIVERNLDGAIVHYSPLLLLLLHSGRRRESLSAMPWLLVVLQIIAIVLAQVVVVDGRLLLVQLQQADAKHLFEYAAATSMILAFFSLRNATQCRFAALWNSLLTVGPLLLVAMVYALTERFSVDWRWGITTGILGVAYVGIAAGARKKRSVESLVVWLFFGGHFALSLAAMMVSRNASLTLVFAVQMISVSWIITRFRLPELGWVLKILVALVVFRLSFNPWIIGYPTDVHWSLWTFGGATLCCLAAARLLRVYPHLSKWTEAAAMHLLVLTLWSETRYWLYDGAVFTPRFTALEAGLYMVMFGAVGLAYYRRSLVSQHLQGFCQLFSRVLISLALLNYVIILGATVLSLEWVWGEVSRTPVANLILLLFGMPLFLGGMTALVYQPRFYRAALVFSGVAAFVFISLEIRHLWQGSIRMDSPAGDGELYTYSAVWLCMAVATILGGAWHFGHGCYRAGMVLLVLVIAKIFLVDMSDLQGLLRVASFLGLGLGLLGISYLYQQIRRMQARE